MRWLANQGHDCTVITTFPYYPQWKIQAPYKNGWFKKEKIDYPDSGGSIVIYRCPFYVPSKPTAKRRVIQDFSFWTSMSWVAGMLRLKGNRQDLIITVAPPFHLGYLGVLLKKRIGGKLVYHIQDMQIEAAENLNMLSNKGIFDRIYKAEKHIMVNADFISSISAEMIKKIKAKIDREILYFPNWVDTTAFHPVNGHSALKEKWGYKQDDMVLLYSGASGEKQGLENIILAAEDLKLDKNIHFVICSTGPYKEVLTDLAEKSNLSNVKFLPVQGKEDFNEFLNMADYHLVLQKGNASDLVMPSKLATILAVGGVSIVTTLPGTSLYNVIHDHDLGYTIEPDNHSELSVLVGRLKLRRNAGEKRANARNYATNHLNIDHVMAGFLEKVLG